MPRMPFCVLTKLLLDKSRVQLDLKPRASNEGTPPLCLSSGPSMSPTTRLLVAWAQSNAVLVASPARICDLLSSDSTALLLGRCSRPHHVHTCACNPLQNRYALAQETRTKRIGKIPTLSTISPFTRYPRQTSYALHTCSFRGGHGLRPV